jgi:protein-S-isoprenylcysteine O-methyltransferase Ste14
MRENLMSGSMWQGMETRAFRPRRHPLTLPVDWRDSARFSNIFLASGFSCSQTESQPAHQRLTQTVGQQKVAAMDNTKAPKPRQQRPAGIPRWLALALAPVVWLVALPAVHAGVPWALSHLGPRYGWAEGGPSGWNLLGYIPVAAGAVLLFWIMIFEFSQKQNLPQWVPIDLSPVFLMTGGPYAFSRNPMYIGELAWSHRYDVTGLLADTPNREPRRRSAECF